MIRGLVLRLIKAVDPDLSLSIHKDNEIRPYSVSNIFFPHGRRPKWKNGNFLFHPSNQLSFNFKTINQQVSQSLVQALLTSVGETLVLADKSFILESVQLQSEHITDETFKNSFPRDIFSVRFLSPTQFTPLKLPGVYLFPEPNFLFGNLAHLAQDLKLTIQPFNINEFLEYITQNVYARKYKLHTNEIKMGKLPPIVGFKGWVEYVNKDPKGMYGNMIPFLLKIGEIINVGKKRTAGMGEMNFRLKSPKYMLKKQY